MRRNCKTQTRNCSKLLATPCCVRLGTRLRIQPWKKSCELLHWRLSLSLCVCVCVRVWHSNALLWPRRSRFTVDRTVQVAANHQPLWRAAQGLLYLQQAGWLSFVTTEESWFDPRQRQGIVLHSIQTGCGAHTTFSSMGIRVSFIGSKGTRRAIDDSRPSNASSEMWTLPDCASYINLLGGVEVNFTHS